MSEGGWNDLSVISLTWTALPALSQVGRLLATGPSDYGLQQIQESMRRLDKDDAIEQSVLKERAFFLGQFWNASREWYASPRDASYDVAWYVFRPWLARHLFRTVEITTELLERRASAMAGPHPRCRARPSRPTASDALV
jgi:hypothetical protein